MSEPTPSEDDRGRPATGWKSRARAVYQRVPAVARRPLVAVVGVGLLVAGLVMLVLPGPGLLTLAAAMAVLALEFPVARRVLEAIRARVARHVPAARRDADQQTTSRDSS